MATKYTMVKLVDNVAQGLTLGESCNVGNAQGAGAPSEQQIADAVAAYLATNPPQADLSAAWPIGSVFASVVSESPATLLGFGVWQAFGAGRMLVGYDANDADFNAAEKTGGAKTVTLTEAQMPAHTHVQNAHGHAVSDPGHVHSLPAFTHATGNAANKVEVTNSTTASSASTGSQTTGVTVGDATAVNQQTGGGQAHDNMPPFVTVYLWKRVE